MNENCRKIKELIAEQINDEISRDSNAEIAEHMKDCQSCRDYQIQLQQQDQLLDELVKNMKECLIKGENDVIKAISCFDNYKADLHFADRRFMIRRLITRFAGAAVLIAGIGAYFVITLTWIAQIRDCFQVYS